MRTDGLRKAILSRSPLLDGDGVIVVSPGYWNGSRGVLRLLYGGLYIDGLVGGQSTGPFNREELERV